MDCTSARTVLTLYLDQELGGDESGAFERHVESCALCRQALASERALKSSIRALPRAAAPAGLRSRVRAAIPASSAPAVSARWRFAAPALAAGLALFLIGGALGWTLAPSGDDFGSRDALSAHMRALVSGRMTDVASSDRHTVKPWFNGRVELAPMVEDLAAQGFPLEGGRVDFVDGRRAAALVYRRRQHVISLFVWPGPDTRSGPTSVQGYNLVQWSANGLRFSAISDLNRAELETFAKLVRERSPSPKTGQ
jgi:anti-sigma factor (TIGR02949 family)